MNGTEKRKLQTLLNRLALAPMRTCQSMHACCLCSDSIMLGQQYRDKGLKARAHLYCITNKREEIAAK